LNRRSTVVSSVVSSVLSLATVAMAGDAFAGTWNLILTKSKYCPGADPASKNQAITVTAQENVIKLVGDTVDSERNAWRFEVAAKCDGRDEPNRPYDFRHIRAKTHWHRHS